MVFCLKSLVRIIIIGDMFRLRDPASSAAIVAAAAHAESGSSSDSEQENILLNIAEDGGGEGGGDGGGDGCDSGPVAGESARTGKNIYNDDDIIRVDDDRYIFNPYNTENVDVTLADVESILARYGVPSQVHNFEL